MIKKLDYSLIFKHLLTVKRLIIGEDLFGKIGEFTKFTKISCHQIKTSQY